MTEAVIYNDPTKLSTNVLQPTVPVIPKKSFSRLYGKHDVFDGEYNLSQKLLAEFLGTALFVYGVVSSNVFFEDPSLDMYDDDYLIQYYDYPICRILGSCCMGGVIIYIFGRVSGAHFNPAVSLGLFIRHKLSGMELVLYIVAQLLGGFLGCVFVGLCRRGKFKKMAGNAIDYYLITTYRNSTSKNGWCYVSAFLFEIFGTFILVMFILASCERDNYLGPALGLAFSSVLIALSGIGGRISGCSLNPARSFAPALVQVMAGGNKDPIKQIWIYLVGPLLGAVIAAFVWPLFVYQF
jgi:MIP family channel proteins